MPKDVPQDMWLHCPHREWHDATPCPASSNIPVSAWGAVFPGDEGGYECALGCHPCDGIPPITCCPRYVEPQEQREDGVAVLCCPECAAESDERVEMYRRREGYDQADYEDVYVCPRCGVEWTAQEVAEYPTDSEIERNAA